MTTGRSIFTKDLSRTIGVSVVVVFIVGMISGFGWLAFSALLLAAVYMTAWPVAVYQRSVAVDGVSKRVRNRLVTFCLSFAAFFSLLLSTLIPPLQSPDEYAHLGRAYGLLTNQVLVQNLGDKANLRVDEGLIEYYSAWSSLAFHSEHQVTREMDSNASSLHWQGVNSALYNPAAIYFPALYAPASIGMGVTLMFSQRPWVAVSWARMAMWVASISMLILALLIVQVGYRFMCASMLLPMTLAQIGSANLDSMTIGGSFLLIALFTWQGSAISRLASRTTYLKAETASWLLVLLLALAKPNFLVFLLFPLYLTLCDRKWMRLMPMAAVAVLVLGWQFHVSQAFANPNPVVSAPPFERIVDTILSPLEMAALIERTLVAKLPFYWQSMVGILGWLDTPLARETYLSAAILLGFCLCADMLSPGYVKPSARATYGLLFSCYCIGSMLLLWVTWTPVGSSVIEGVQGRYFLPVLPFIAVALSGLGSRSFNFGVRVAGFTNRLLFLVFCLYALSLTVDIPTLLIKRYWL